MKLPNYEKAIVPQAKITRYLLSATHEDGQHKARFFVRFGFTIENWELLAQALIQHAADHEVVNVLETPHGKHYVVEGILPTPTGESPNLRSVWAIDDEGESPRLITAYPLKAVKEDDDD